MLFGIKKKSIIAMKGHPFTRKTEFATLIAASLRCPLLSLDDFLDSLSPEYLQTSPSSMKPEDFAFQIICQMANSHLSAALFDNVVIDSPLSSRSHLNQLIKLASSLSHTRLVIVECKPKLKDEYAWQTTFQEFLDRNPDRTRKWYKARDWQDVEKSIREDYDESSDGCKVSKLVLDPLSDYGNYKINPTLLSEKLFTPPPFIEAVKYMITREEDDDTDHIVVYARWRQSQNLNPTRFLYRNNNDDSGSRRPCKGTGHSITNYAEEGLGYEANCMACAKQVLGTAYSCKDCSLALHKECAESFDNENSGQNPFPDLKYSFRYCFPMSSACAHCKEFSDNCSSCLFENHLRCRLMPTIIRHDCEEHFLSILLPPLNEVSVVRNCAACGRSGRFNLYSCKVCCVAYHYECLTHLPRRVEHVHGGHHHQMQLKFSSEEAEDYLCQVCFEKELPYIRDPKLWFYSCKECPYEAHLLCVSEIQRPKRRSELYRTDDFFKTLGF